MVFHVFTNESVYSTALLKLLEKNIEIENHYFFFGFGKKHKIKYHYPDSYSSQIKYLHKPKDLLFFFRNAKIADWIYLHYLAYDPTLLFWSFRKSLLEKATWIVWGNDVYSYFKRNKNLKTRIYEYLRVGIIERIPEIAAFVREDYDLIKSLYRTKAVYHDILYPIPVNIKHLNFEKEKSKTPDVKFLIGNSGDPSNLHSEIIDLLSKFKDEKIQVFCPLSYGCSREYAEDVVRHGKAIFGDKFVALLSHLEETEYGRFLNTIDIAVMNHKRQQGLGNILALLYLDKKVFLRSNITSYQFFKRQNCEIFNIEDLRKQTIEELIDLKEQQTNNRQIVTSIMEEKNYLRLWLNLLNEH